VAGKKISERVKDAFSSTGTQEYAENYLDALRASNRERETSYRRTLVLLVLLCVASELLTQAAVQEMNIGGVFKVTDPSFIHELLPLAIGFLYYEMISLHTLGLHMKKVHDQLLDEIHAPICNNNLQYYLHPPSTQLALQILTSESKGLGRGLVVTMHAPFYLVLMGFVPLFEFYALYNLWSLYWSTNPIIVGLVTVFSILFLLLSLLSFKYAMRAL
jgi:hypothetical protein